MAIRVAGELYESITGQLFEIGRQLRQPKGYPFDPVRLQKHLQGAIMGRFNDTEYPVHVLYDLVLESAIRYGKYDYVDPNITAANFPSTRQGTAAVVDIILVHYGRDMEDEEIDKDLDRQGLKDAELPELLALGAKYPDLQRQFPIVARGSVWLDPALGDRYVPYLSWNGVKCYLDLCWLGGRWGSDARFAAVRKPACR